MVAGGEAGSTTVEMLDAMQQLMTGDTAFFDAAFLGELRACWDDAHPDLATSQDSAWQASLN